MSNKSTKYQYPHDILRVQKIYFKIPPAANFDLPRLQGHLVHKKFHCEGHFLVPYDHLKPKKNLKKFEKIIRVAP